MDGFGLDFQRPFSSYEKNNAPSLISCPFFDTSIGGVWLMEGVVLGDRERIMLKHKQFSHNGHKSKLEFSA